MVEILLQGKPVQTVQDVLKVGEVCPAFTLCRGDLSDFNLSTNSEANLVLNIFPSIDTAVCASSVREFNRRAAMGTSTQVLCISADLPFAQQRFCGAEGIANVTMLSSFRNPEFGEQLGLTIASGPMRGLLARTVMIIDKKRQIQYSEVVPEITQEPDYEKAFMYL